MNTETLEQKLESAIKTAVLLFKKDRVTGSTGNISFRHEDKIYISCSGACFGWLEKKDFAVLDMEGNVLGERKPSKEYPLHLSIYRAKSSVNAVLHTHSFYSTLWSCLEHKDEKDVMPAVTPYLSMKVGRIGLIPKAQPGSEELFRYFEDRINDSDGYLLAHHGVILGDTDMQSVYYDMEEMEENAKINWYMRKE
ncbi:MAG: class II aldolase/adducin family protein [Eubacteriales bacterium]|nr:class II aldolase/adducin family protein [Eubacteriales bacterium]